MTIYRGPGGTGEARTDNDVTEVRIIADEAEGYKNDAAASASAAASSASAAATAETNAGISEANAAVERAAAEDAQAAAEAAQAAAEAAQTAAEAAQTAAELAETNAETAEANAETAEANAETAQAAAEAALASAQAVYDDFDDRYLGAKSSNPTVDNDGNALLTGAMYFNTVAPEMRVYNGSVWQNFAAASAVSSFNSRTGAVTLTDTDVNTALGYTAANNSSVLLKANNLSDLTSASTARTNLGLGTAATTASTAYATAAQGTNADTAYGWGNHASAGYAADNAVVKLTGDQTVAGTKTFSSTIAGSVSGNAGTVTNGVYTSGSYADPSWITSLAGSKVSGNIPGNAANVTGTIAVANGGTGSTTASAARTALGLAIGTDVQAYDAELSTLAGMSSSRATYLASTEGFGFRNRIINGDMRIDQRNAGASVTIPAATVTYTLDRYRFYEDTDGVISVQQVSDAPAGFVNSMKVTATTADASLGATQRVVMQQNIEGYNVADLAFGSASAATVTLSFWVKSSLTGTFGGALSNSDSNRSYPFTYAISSANTWEQKSVTIAGDTSGTWLTTNGIGLRVVFGLGVGSTYSGTANAWSGNDYNSATGATSVIGTLNATWQLTGVQLEAGSVASPFERRDYGRELQMCQRYYETGTYTYYGGYSNASVVASVYTPVYFKVTKRATPTIAGTNAQGTFASDSITVDSVALGRSTTVANRINNGTFTASAEL